MMKQLGSAWAGGGVRFVLNAEIGSFERSQETAGHPVAPSHNTSSPVLEGSKRWVPNQTWGPSL